MSHIENPSLLTIETIRNSSFDNSLKLWAKELFNVQRYKGLDMAHRTNLLIHSMRTKFLSQGIGIILDGLEDQNIFFDFDHFKVVTAANHHDVAEIITGDILAPEKKKMSEEQKRTLMEQEIRATTQIYRRYFIPGSDEELQRYLETQEEVRHKETLESRIVNVADKWDALGEKMHEIACGNDTFIPLVAISQQTFEDFKNYDFWPYLQTNPFFRFDQIPSPNELQKLPKIDVKKLDPSSPNFEEDVLKTIKDWPVSYRSWLEISFMNFWSYAPEFIFPGWYPGLDKKLGLSS